MIRACASGALAAMILALSAQAAGAPSRSASPTSPAAHSDENLPPKVARDPATWIKLLAELERRDWIYGAMAAAQRMPLLFADVSVQEAAFRSLIQLSDRGYPEGLRGPARSLFFSGDLEPSPRSDADLFPQDYAFYKAIVNRERGFEAWARYHLTRVVPEKSERYQHYLALQAYSNHKLGEAEAIVRKILSAPPEHRSLATTRQLLRLQARIRYELKNYSGSLEIYEGFLLRLPEVTPSDWIEAAWNLYFLKQYPKALGYLYNLESQAAGSEVLLEKYLLRGMIHHSLCNMPLIAALTKSFEDRYLPTVNAIKTGEKLSGNRVLSSIRTPMTASLLALRKAEDGLQTEEKQLSRLSSELEPLARWLYSTERKLVDIRFPAIERAALESAAQELLLTHESLKFLGFEILRSKVDPDAVFSKKAPQSPLLDTSPNGSFLLSWTQPGDFWRDERLKYLAEVQSQCGK